MFYRSLFTNAFTACALFSGGIALADSFNISNDDPSAYSLVNSLGEPLNAGNAILGAFSSNTWSYDVTTSRWNFQGNSYAQDQLKYSDLMSMQNNFTGTLTNIPEEQNGGVTNGSFNLSGDYSSPSLASPVYLMVTGQDGETAFFVFKNVSSDSLLNYDNINISGAEPFDLWLTTKEQALTNDLDYYAECILGNIKLENNTIQLLIPEPATAAMSLLGLAALMVRRKRK
ncbi:PEP-CTERM sorting domain-containing protein [Akkermansia sp.]|uniref:PEP-CTERM sorting domain-containing protein n=1 Tax=Akkermansia sp. TaxID=1872421 RepID=UPI0025C487F8|nr:PEP-CTERM sorting domain-containing protein [Akkermansia sp.]MCD8273332.1 PEP-CTERM sorting domain-containing protein [Akkermansia sp.]